MPSHRSTPEDNESARFALLIDIEVDSTHRAAIAQRLGDYLQQLGLLFREGSGYLGGELYTGDRHRLLGRLHWRRREDWEASWDCQRTRSEVFADSLLRLGARSIQFDSMQLGECA